MRRMLVAVAVAVAAAAAATTTPAAAIASVVGPRCEYRNGGPAVDTNGAASLTAGPLAPTQEKALRVTVVCTVQTSRDIWVGEVLRARQSTLGTAGVLVAPTVSGPGGGPLYVCTFVTWTTVPGGGTSWYHDADLATPGVQCPPVV